jgi:hypothetical protein
VKGVGAHPTSGAATVADTVLKTDHARTQVWLEKGVHKLNLDSHGIILKGYDPEAYFIQRKAAIRQEECTRTMSSNLFRRFGVVPWSPLPLRLMVGYGPFTVGDLIGKLDINLSHKT